MKKNSYQKFKLLLFALSVLFCLPVMGQQKITVKGQVTDFRHEPITGASVTIKGTLTGTVTDVNGNFSLPNVSNNATLIVSFVGMKTQNVAVGNSAQHIVVLTEDTEELGEVVVVGYGVQKRANLSGSVDQIGTKELETKPITNISKGLQGMIPNLNIDFASGEPGQAAKINVRGLTSINGGSPLILIDGIASGPEELNRLLPEDISNISVLKDASSAAIYGARAAFGVILITTKEGRNERIQVSYNNNFSWKRPSILPEKTSDPYIYLKMKNIAVLNTPWSGGHVANDEKLEWARQKSDNPSIDPVRLNPLDKTQWEYMGNKDWTKYFLDKYTFSSSHQVSVSGATAKSSFYLSGGIDDENGILSDIVKNDNFKRYSFRAKGSYKVTDWFLLSNNSSYVMTERDKPGYFWNADMGMFYNIASYDHDKNPDGTWANSNAGRTMARLNNGGKDLDNYSRIQNTFSGELSLFDKRLKINTNYSFVKGVDDYQWYQTKYQIGFGPNDVREEGASSAYRTFTTDFYNVFDVFGTLNIEKNKHQFTSIIGFNQEYSKWNWVKAEREGLISSGLPTIGLASGEPKVDEQYKDWAIRGVFYRLNYNYANRYIVEFNGRYDGTSRFPKNKRFGFFPSVSAAWKVDSEKFFEPLRQTISQFKLRASYGSLGNQLVSEYGYVPSMNSSVGNHLIAGKLPQIVSSPGLVSSNYTWETVVTKNMGIDLNFLDDKIQLTGDMFRRDTEGMLAQGKVLPGILGTSVPKENAADMKTTGWEISLAYHGSTNLGNSPLRFTARLMLSDSRSWITKFDNPSKLLGQYYKGAEFGEIWGLQSDGFFTSKDEIAKLDESALIPWGALDIVPGWPRYKDLNNDKKITKGTTVDDAHDLSVIGNNSPRYRYGVNLNADWKNFDLTIFLQGIGKKDYYPLSFLYWSFYQQPYAGGQTNVFDFYRPVADSEADMAKHSKAYIAAGLANQNLNANYPVLQCWLADKNLGTTVNSAMGLAIPQTKYMLDGSYLRVKNITLGYTIPDNLSNKLKISRLRFFVSADNIFEWSGVKKFFDPESITNESQFGYVYPFNRQYMFGLNVTF